MSKNVNNQMGYAGKVELKDVIKSVKNYTEEMKVKEQELNALDAKIDSMQEEINNISDKTKANMKNVSKKISDYVKILQSFGEGKTDSSYTSKLQEFDSGELYKNKLPEFEEFLNNNYPIEESHYSNTPFNLTNTFELVNVDFHTKARESDFLSHVLDDNWHLYQKDCIDKCIKIPIDNNTKTFEFGIKYYQILSNNIKQERYYTGKIILTGLINNHTHDNIIPTELKCIIYNGDLNPVYTPEFNFKFLKDNDFIYIYLDTVSPLRLLPLLDINTRNIYPYDILELNTIKPNLNLYIDNDTLYDRKPISLNYFINFSLLDTTKYSNNKIEIISIDNLPNDLNLIDILIIKSSNSYRNLIGFDYNNSSPMNKELSFNNYNTINKNNIINNLIPSKVKYKINDKATNLVNLRSEAFRRISVIANPPKSNYFYITLEENLDYMISLNNNIHRSQNMNYAAYPNIDMQTTYWVDYIHGKYKGKSCIVTSNYYRASNRVNFYNEKLYIITNYTNKNKSSIHTITFPSKYIRTIPNWRKKFIFYDDYTEYFYICFYPTSGYEHKSYNVYNIYTRTKDFITYEEFDTSNKLSLNQDISNLWYFNNMETDNNGRFIVSYYNTNSSLTILIYDISPNTIYNNNKIIPSKVINLPHVSNARGCHNILYSTKNSTWFISSHEYNYYYSIDNGNTWINNRIKQPTSDNRVYYHLSHDKDFLKLGIFGYNQKSLISRPTENPYYSNDGVGLIQTYAYEAYQDLDHNGKMLMGCSMRGDGFTRVSDLENISFKAYGVRKNSNKARYWDSDGYWDGREFIGNTYLNGTAYRCHVIPMRDQENDIYIDAQGTKGLMTWNYNMDMGIWVVNRLYRVNKADYTMVEIVNLANNGKVLTTMNGRREASDIAGWKTAPVRPISQHNGRNSDSNMGLYDGYANKVNMPDFYNYYDKQTKGLRFYQYWINDGSVTFGTWSTANYGSGKVPDNYNIFTYNEKLKIRLGSINKTTNKNGTIVLSKDGGSWKKIFQYSNKDYNVLTTTSTHEIDKGKTFNNTTYNAFIIDNKLFLLGSHALDIVKNINFDADLADGNGSTAACGYEAGDFDRKLYPWVEDYIDTPTNYSRQIDVLGSPNWAYMSYYDEKRRKIVFFLDESLNSINRTGIFKKSVIGCTYKGMAYNSHYDGKYWKGIMVYDIDKDEFSYNGCLFGKLGYTGDLDDIDYIDFFDVIWTNATLDMSSHVGEDEKGTYIVSPKTGNIYRMLDDTWMNWKKEECDYKISQIVKNDIRNSYVYFLNNNLTDFMKNKFAVKCIREIPLTVLDRKITKENALDFKTKVIDSIKAYQKDMKTSIMFKMEIVISLPPTDRDRKVRIYEVGSYNGSEYMIFRYLVDNYTYSSEFEKDNGYPLKPLNTDQNLYKHYNMIDRTIYTELRGIDLKLSQKINQPLINLDSLLVHPTEINITFYPTTAETVNIDYKVSRNINKIPYNDELTAYVEVLDNKGYSKSVEYKTERDASL